MARKTSKDYFEAGAEKLAEAEAIQEAAEAADRLMTAEESAKVGELVEEAQGLKERGDHALAYEQTSAAFSEPIRLPGNADPATPPGSIHTIAAQPRDIEAEARCGFDNFGSFALAVRDAMGPGGARDSRLEFQAAATGMSQGVPASGGFLVPPAFSTTIWDGLNAAPDNLLGMTDNYTITGESLTFNANAETSRATGSRYGGIRSYWLSEAAEMTPSYPKVRQLTVEPQQLGVLVYVTDKLLKNSAVALEQYLTRAAIDEINFFVGDAIINGNGVGKPLGILNSGCVVSVDKETSQAADTILFNNLSKMWARLHPRSHANAVWFINVDVQPELDNLFLAVQNVGETENVGGMNPFIYNPAANTIKGRPIIPIEYCATAGDVGDIILADMKGYVSGTRGGVESAMSIHLRFNFNESCFRFIFECDGKPWLLSALTPYKGTDTLSTFVTLAVRT